ncbi:bifunctional folylpolyglutamate synthase/dihydrofolate synthase [Alkalihalobacterium elongatum]|uniref:bifunctional folylpolyglutamate synthase/dihydrofolate synthase n=1 Tax=Alkalihalobacterium elongatum TaxID=2675466 RepID=UPI001C1FCCF1|nr:folylpolyglutamate synthase/dihydrofolate synthase family protein [Alkalihalobacterium elongatum]
MTRSFEEVVDFIQGRNIIQLGLENMIGFLEEIGNPHRKLKIIHIAGTNGKGSTLNFTREMLIEAGYTVGAFTTPAVLSYEEQISINKEPITKADFIEVFQQLSERRETFEEREKVMLTEFECLTAMMFYYFAEFHPVDFVLLETGMGGRLDATNVSMPLLTVITNIGMDHMHLLGNTKEKIALEKAGIIKAGVPLITGEKEEAILDIFKQQVSQKRSKLYILQQDFSTEDVTANNEQQIFSYTSTFSKLANLELTMLGEHQVKNAALALMVIDYLKTYQALMITEEEIRNALRKATWKGRFEKVSDTPLIYLDGAHNNEGIAALADLLRTQFADKKISVLFGATKEKEVEEMLTPLYNLVDEISFTSFDFPRAAVAKDSYEASSFNNKKLINNWEEEINTKLKTLDQQDLFLITGSLYFIGKVKQFLQNIIQLQK